MKRKLFISLCLVFSIALLNAQAQSLQIAVPSELCAEQFPSSGNKITYTASEVLSQCVSIYGNNPGQMAVDLMDGARTAMNADAPAYVLSATKLFSVSGTETMKTYNFGQQCGEEGYDDANVNVQYANYPANAAMSITSSKATTLPVYQDQILYVNSNDTPTGPTQQTFLHVAASQTSTATISIGSSTQQGQVFVCLYSSATGQPLAMLHSKSSDLNFTVSESVYVIPMIKPNSFGDQRATTVLFEVGDPRRNGKVVAEEEGE